jgi:hypothetical protein
LSIRALLYRRANSLEWHRHLFGDRTPPEDIRGVVQRLRKLPSSRRRAPRGALRYLSPSPAFKTIVSGALEEHLRSSFDVRGHSNALLLLQVTVNRKLGSSVISGAASGFPARRLASTLVDISIRCCHASWCCYRTRATAEEWLIGSGWVLSKILHPALGNAAFT